MACGGIDPGDAEAARNIIARAKPWGILLRLASYMRLLARTAMVSVMTKLRQRPLAAVEPCAAWNACERCVGPVGCDSDPLTLSGRVKTFNVFEVACLTLAK